MSDNKRCSHFGELHYSGHSDMIVVISVILVFSSNTETAYSMNY